MNSFGLLAFAFLGLSFASADKVDDDNEDLVDEARFFFMNSTNTKGGLTLLSFTILAFNVIFSTYVAIALRGKGDLLKGIQGPNRHASQNTEKTEREDVDVIGESRSMKDGYDFSALNVLYWISMLHDVYEKFDYNDSDCQKRLVCEVMKEPDFYGSYAQTIKSGLEYANILKLLRLPDYLDDLLDKSTEANSRAKIYNKDCSEFFQCPFSIKEAMKKL